MRCPKSLRSASIPVSSHICAWIQLECVPRFNALLIGSEYRDFFLSLHTSHSIPPSLLTGNGLILKGGKEASHSNAVLHALVAEAITSATEGKVSPALVSLVTSREDIAALLSLDHDIDLVIPRGSGQLVASIQASTRIPVMGHSEGLCHLYIDKAADPVKAARLAVDAKCDYPAACNATETFLLHQDTVADANGAGVGALKALQAAAVILYGGPHALATPTLAGMFAGEANFRTEYGDLRASVEVVADIAAAVQHINKNGSGHTECIVSEDPAATKLFLAAVDAACVFANASTRFADGFRFGLGAEVGISTSRLHARGPVGVEGLTSTKWRLVSALDAHVASAKDGSELPACHTVGDFSQGARVYTHKKLDL